MYIYTYVRTYAGLTVNMVARHVRTCTCISLYIATYKGLTVNMIARHVRTYILLYIRT